MATPHTLRIFNETKVRMPRTRMTTIYTDLLQPVCSLNVIGIEDSEARRLNREHRDTDTPASVLTFPPNNETAELYLNMSHAKRTAKEEGISLTDRLLFLYLHGVLHLLGHTHGPEMESLEDKYATTYMYEAKKGKRCCCGPQQHQR